MGYTLQAFIGDEKAFSMVDPSPSRLINLAQGKVMIPISSDACEEWEIPFLPLTDGGQFELPESIELFARKLGDQVAYVEAEFFGGDGTQAAAVWENSKLILGPVVNNWAINQALKKLGVERENCRDEFEALGLGAYRDTDDWISKKIIS